MKKALCVVLVVVMMLSLVACGKTLKGTYKTDEALGSYVAYEFSGSKVTVKTYVLGNLVVTVEGKYEINDNEITFTYAEDEETGDAVTGTQTFEEGDGFIKIGMLTLKKQ